MPAPSELRWDDEAELCGIRVRAHFFDPNDVDTQDDFVSRQLPVFKRARPKLLFSETDRKNFVAGELIGQPDAVLSHGSGLISLEYKSNSGRSHERQKWRRQLRLRSMLQCIGGAIVVSAHYGKPAAAVLRVHNVVYHLDPSPPVLEWMTARIKDAKRYWDQAQRVSISQLAAFCEARIDRDFRVPDESEKALAAEGERRHALMLRR